MTSLKTLPLTEGTKLIVLDEGVDAMYARKLIAGWIQMFKEKDPNRTFDLLLFSDPKSTYLDEPQVFMSNNVKICDYYTVDINELDLNAISENDFNTLEHILNTVNAKSTVIVDCLTSLILFVGLSKALWFLEKLRQQVPQVICIYRRDFMENKMQCIETLGSTYVNISEHNISMKKNTDFVYMVEIIHRKAGGGILRQQELVCQNTSYDIQSTSLQTKKPVQMTEEPKQKIESSFRIGISEHEMKQKMETVLPYTAAANTTNTSKIHYQPEDVDDFDEEDPDDDLCF